MATPSETDIRAAQAAWEEKTAGARERKESFDTDSIEDISRAYGPDSVADVDYLQDVGFPGEYPFTRRRTAHHVSGTAVVDAAVRRFRHADRIQ